MYFERNGLRMFSVAGIEVSVSLWYGVLMGFILFSNFGLQGLMLVLAITISILIHEFGHAVPSKLYKLRPSILLHGFGGLCSHQPADSDFKDVVIVILGPLVQIAVGFGAWLLMYVVPSLSTGAVGLFLWPFVWVSMIWGLLNLVLPVYPLDGGQLFHMLLRRITTEAKAQDITLKTSILCAIVGGIYALTQSIFFLAFLAAFITMGNIATLQSGTRLVERRGKVRASSFVKETMVTMEQAYADEDWREAARLCHVLRSGRDPIPPKQMARVWEVLAVTAVQRGEFDEAKGWLRQAPDTAAVRAAQQAYDAHTSEG